MFLINWDPGKARANKAKHDISFEEAATAFYDNQAILFDDPDHSEEEERYNLLGLTNHARLCIVSHCYRSGGDEIRIISARKANSEEQRTYFKYHQEDIYDER